MLGCISRRGISSSSVSTRLGLVPVPTYGCVVLPTVTTSTATSVLEVRSSSTAAGASGGWAPSYEPTIVEGKWQERWAGVNATKSVVAPDPDRGKNFYALSMFPYPSGNLHMGHVRVYAISDTVARFQRMKGLNVIHPMGWDAFGLPAENAAVERGVDPESWTRANIAQMRKQFDSLGLSFDWEREVTTCLPSYYKWTQALFTKLFARGLAYQANALVNWDPVDNTVLANEQVDGEGRSWRSGALVERRQLKQWLFRITDYADRLDAGLDSLEDWPLDVRTLQRQWIGSSKGVYAAFKLSEKDARNLAYDETVKVFTTRADTIYGVSFVAVSPDHPLAQAASEKSAPLAEKLQGLLQTQQQNRHTAAGAADTSEGIELGVKAVHPLTGEEVPVYAAPYVLSDYGTGAVMGVPCHDDRDAAFAAAHNLSARVVVQPAERDDEEGEGVHYSCVYTDDGTLVNSGEYTGLTSAEARSAIARLLETQGTGGEGTQYKLRDWLVSRQRFWGAPIPIVHCEGCEGPVAVPEDQLPVLLPDRREGDVGKGLTDFPEWVQTECPECGGPASRDTDTMDTFVDSSWYFMRFVDPTNSSSLFDTATAASALPVDVYMGGKEHAILHLLYARFISHFCYDEGLVPTAEPFKKLLAQGMVHGPTYKDASGRYLLPHEHDLATEVVYEKMSKSKYNGVDIDPVVAEYGADTVRLFLLFKAPPEKVVNWDADAIRGQQRWLGRLWTLAGEAAGKVAPSDNSTGGSQSDGVSKSATNASDGDLRRDRVETIERVSHVLDVSHTFNAAIGRLMEFSNSLAGCSPEVKESAEWKESVRVLTRLLAPFAPHIASEMWEVVNGPETTVFESGWPSVDDVVGDVGEAEVQTVVQISGKKRAVVSLPASVRGDSGALENALRADPDIARHLDGKTVRRVIVVKEGQLVNFVV